MYTKEQVDEMLSQVEQEFENALGSIAKSEENIEEETEIEVEAAAEELEKTEEVESVEEDSYETIEELYASMDKSEIEAHYASIKEVMFGKSEDKDEDDMEKCGEMKKAKKRDHAEGDAAEKEWESKASQTEGYEDLSPHGKKQKAKEIQAAAAKQAGFGKSEDDMELEMLKSENEELKKNYEQLNELVSKLFNTKKAPAQKAVTNVNYIAKSEETEVEEKEDFSNMSKNEVTAKLKSIDYSELKKSDREAINNYYLDNGSVESIKHLIRE